MTEEEYIQHFKQIDETNKILYQQKLNLLEQIKTLQLECDQYKNKLRAVKLKVTPVLDYIKKLQPSSQAQECLNFIRRI